MKSLHRNCLSILAIAFGTLSGCQKKVDLAPPGALLEHRQFTPSEEFEKRRWIYRVARLLRGGAGVVDPSLVDALVARSEDEVIDYFIDRPEFGDTVLDFNLKFLGFRLDRIRESDGELVGKVFDFPSALHSAREAIAGGDYLKLLELEQPLYLPPLKPPVPLDGSANADSFAEIRKRNFAIIQSALRNHIEELEKNPAAPVEASCMKFREYTNEGNPFMANGFYYPFVDLGFNTNIWYGTLVEACIGPFRPENLDFALELKKIFAMNEKLAEEIEVFDPAKYSVRNLADVRALDIAKTGIASRWLMFGDSHRQALMNSSTNFNRKRGAYILSRFFCDDLTPINVESPSDHAGGAHGSEASCRACHYKLDPMSGFFRDIGYLFSDYSKSPKVRFDDNAMADTAEYQKAWLAPEGSGRKWEIGFVRSATKDDLNQYGSSMEDLFRIIRSAREVKRCLVKRMFEYFVSEQQTLDAGYLEYLTDIFVTRAKENSTAAFKEVSRKILLSQSFRQTDPVSETCYDYPPGFDPSGKPPCKVAFLLEKNCASCHSSTFDRPYLDLSSWEKLPGGDTGFPHLDESGTQLPAAITFERILDRLTTSDPARRMPLKKHMDPFDREELFKWVNENVSGQKYLIRLARKERLCPYER